MKKNRCCADPVVLLLVLCGVLLLGGYAWAQDDAYEENDTAAAATNMTTVWGQWLSQISGLGIQADEDWYRVNAVLVTRMLIECRFRHGAGDVDIQLYDATGMTILASSVGYGNRELIDYTVPSTGLYLIRVFGANAGNAYDLWWDVTNAGADDKYEPNDTTWMAYNLSSYPQTWLSSILPDMGIQQDDDYYRISVASGYERVLIDCRFTHAAGDIDIQLLDSTGTVVAWSNGIVDNEFIAHTVPSAGIYFIRVHGAVSGGGNMGNPYDLWWDDVPPTEDAYEPNPSVIQPYHPGSDWAGRSLSGINGWGALYDEDWYEIDVPAGNLRVKVGCLFSSALGDINLQLYDAGGHVLFNAVVSGDNEYIDTTVSSPGKYYVRVYQNPPYTGNTYDLRWVATRDAFSYPFAADREGWEWFDASPTLSVPAHIWSLGSLEMTEQPGTPLCFGSWESPKDPVAAPHPSVGQILRARFRMRSSVDGSACPGFRLRALAAHMIQSGGNWTINWANRDFNSDFQLFYSTFDPLHVTGREPGTLGTTYTLLYLPEQISSLADADMVVYFACDLVDLIATDNDGGVLYLDQLDVDSVTRPNVGSGTMLPALSFTSFAGWTTSTASLDPGQFNGTSLTVTATASGVEITVAPGNQWFYTSTVSPTSQLLAGQYYRVAFTVTSTETGSGDFGPTVRAGFMSSRYVFSADKQLRGGSTFARFGSSPQVFDIWMLAPEADPNTPGLTEPMSVRFESWLTTSNTGWPFYTNVSGTVRCTQVVTESFPAL